MAIPASSGPASTQSRAVPRARCCYRTGCRRSRQPLAVDGHSKPFPPGAPLPVARIVRQPNTARLMLQPMLSTGCLTPCHAGWSLKRVSRSVVRIRAGLNGYVDRRICHGRSLIVSEQTIDRAEPAATACGERRRGKEWSSRRRSLPRWRNGSARRDMDFPQSTGHKCTRTMNGVAVPKELAERAAV